MKKHAKLKKKVAKKVKTYAKYQVIYAVARVFYVSGLTALIPLIPLILSPADLENGRYAFAIAVTFIFAGFFLLYWFMKKKKAFQALGFMTLIPGMIAVVFSFMGPRRMTRFLEKFGAASPLLEKWVETYVPKAWLLAGIYIIVGVIFVYISEQVR